MIKWKGAREYISLSIRTSSHRSERASRTLVAADGTYLKNDDLDLGFDEKKISHIPSLTEYIVGAGFVGLPFGISGMLDFSVVSESIVSTKLKTYVGVGNERPRPQAFYTRQ